MEIDYLGVFLVTISLLGFYWIFYSSWFRTEEFIKKSRATIVIGWWPFPNPTKTYLWFARIASGLVVLGTTFAFVLYLSAKLVSVLR
jgi:hypothetical protein